MSGYYLGQLAMLLQLVVAIGALTADLPKKDPHAPRIVLAAALLIITGIATYPLYDASLGGAVGLKLAVFAGTLASCTAAIMVLFEATLWQAIFWALPRF